MSRLDDLERRVTALEKKLGKNETRLSPVVDWLVGKLEETKARQTPFGLIPARSERPHILAAAAEKEGISRGLLYEARKASGVVELSRVIGSKQWLWRLARK